MFAPIAGKSSNKGNESTHDILQRLGFVKATDHAGIYHTLPLGLRVQDKLEALIDKHMRSLGAFRLSLSTITSEALWEKTGRAGGTEFFRLRDRKGTKLLLAPTHEEEITQLVSEYTSYRMLPMRVYQIGRKYRDERRPRAGLLRGREFLMKDLYTFDATEKAALETYQDVQEAYKALFDELKLPYLIAEADSGSMGGSLSHEYLYPSTTGEDTIIQCSDCNYTANVETASPKIPEHDPAFRPTREQIAVHHSITTDRKTLINTYYLASSSGPSNPINLAQLASLIPDLDPSTPNALELFEQHFTAFDPDRVITKKNKESSVHSQILNIFDAGLPSVLSEASFSNHTDLPSAPSFISDKRIPTTSISRHPTTGNPLRLLRVRSGDSCPKCHSGTVSAVPAIELAHTFHLGTRYTEPLNAVVNLPDGTRAPMQQGCHGIGVSRMIAAIAEGWRDDQGLNWPRVVAPWEVAIICHPEEERVREAERVYDILAGTDGVNGEARSGQLDVVLDDREKSLVWKMNDADMVGFPILCVLGKSWNRGEGPGVEVQCRRKGIKSVVPLESLREAVEDMMVDL